MKLKQIILLFLLAVCKHAVAADIVWFDGQHPITYSVPKKTEPVVKIALDMWKDDMRQVTGMIPVASQKGTIKVVAGKGPADGFRIYAKGNQIIVEGYNGRGMAYGLLELSRMAGVSPWIWWGDVVPVCINTLRKSARPHHFIIVFVCRLSIHVIIITG